MSVDEDVALRKLEARGRFPYPGTPETYVRELLTEHTGILVSARVLRKRLLSPKQTDIFGKRKRRARVGPWEEAGEVRTYFYASRSPLACRRFKPEHRQQRFVQRLCCDVDPPMNVPCLFGVDEITGVPDWAERLLRKKR